MRTTWLVQTNVDPESTSPAALRRACATEQFPFYALSVIPGSATLPEMPIIDGPVVFHGRTTLILRAFEHPQWRRGIFTLDVARVNHSWKIVECNCFNGSRFYSADVELIVRRVSEHQEQAWSR